MSKYRWDKSAKMHLAKVEHEAVNLIRLSEDSGKWLTLCETSNVSLIFTKDGEFCYQPSYYLHFKRVCLPWS
jgi:hypothetical protein